MSRLRTYDVEYRRHATGPLLLRIYEPEGDGPHPLLVDVHGGAWTSGSRESNELIDEHIASAGVLVAAVDFRQPPDGGYPASLQDINLAIRWLKRDAQRRWDTTPPTGAIGTSSGGHQAAMTALRPHDARYTATRLDGPPVDATLDFCILCWPIVDPLARYRMALAAGRKGMVDSHHAYWGTEEAMTEGNPTLILEGGEPGVALPPTLLLQGTDDDNVTPDMADRYVAAYRRRGGTVQYERFDGQPHSFIKADPESAATARALSLIAAFASQAGAIPVE